MNPPPDLADWWSFDGQKTPGPPNVAADIAGLVAKEGSVIGAGYSSGIVDNALCFDGVNDFVKAPTGDEVNFLGDCHVYASDEFPIDGWVNTMDAVGVTPILDNKEVAE